MHGDPILLEVCVDDAAGLAAAVAGGADRIELCADLSVGGLTPGRAAMWEAARCGLPVFAMVRPRAGDFHYSAAESVDMLAAVAAVKAAGLAGIVTGAARADGALDAALIAALVAAARPLPVTLHRVFDGTPDPFAALEEAIDLGVARILTSGRAANALAGVDRIYDLRVRAADRICVIAGVGVTPDNVAEIVRRSGVREVHGSFSRAAGGRRHTDAAIVRAARAALSRLTDASLMEVQ